MTEQTLARTPSSSGAAATAHRIDAETSRIVPSRRMVSGSTPSGSSSIQSSSSNSPWGGWRQSAEQYGSSDHRVTAASAARRTAAPSTSTRADGMPRAGHTQAKASGPGGGRGRSR
jgi:hypothetical protein